jgi:polysaccharide biosynthesis/export protein
MMQLHARRFAVITLIGCSVAFGQVKEQTQNQTRDKGIELQQAASAMAKDDLSARLASVPMEGPIHPDRYVVGPSDVFQLGLWGPFSVTYPVTVTPEGTVIIPTVGEVAVAGMKLSDAKIRVTQKIRTVYTSGDVTFTLLKPRSIVVTLKGSVLRQGQYVVTSVDRVEKLLSLGANVETSRPNLALQPGMQTSPDISKEDYIKAPKVVQVEEIYNRASMRKIRLMRRNGDTLRVDILKFYATGEDRCNPFLVDGDVVLVPLRHISSNCVGVFGAVNAPGQYEWVEGDSLLALIQIAQGAMNGSDLEHIIIQRLNESGGKAGDLQVNLLNIQKGLQPDVLLQQGDRIIVPLITDNRGISSVIVEGQVKKPGMYPILHGRTKLSEILELVGGFQNDALLSGALVLRRDDRGSDQLGPQASLLRNIRSQQLTAADSAYFYLDMRTSRHPVLVDFAKLIQNRDSTQDIVLRDDDLIYVPSDNRAVLVFGQVQKPAYIPFVPGMRYKDYVARAGGFSELAISGDTKVIKKATLEWLDPSDTVIEPGDQIWVPKEYIKDTRQTWPLIRDIIGVVASVATTVLIAIQVTK